MNGLIAYGISHVRLTISAMLFLLLAGTMAYITIPKEAEPDIQIPIVYVSVTQRGISPEDAERLILRPLETQLKSVANVKEMRATAFEGGGNVVMEFQPGFDAKRAIADVRAKVDDAKRDLPRDADEPKVVEVNLSLFPVIIVAMKGEVPEQTMTRLARQLRTAIEQVPGVLAAELKGARDEVVEIIVEPTLLAAYAVSMDDLVRAVGASNTLIAAGALEATTGRFSVKVPSLLENPEDILKLPVLASGGAVVRLGDVAEVRPTFKDAVTITRVDGKPAITIEVSKRVGANLIDTVDGVKYALEKARQILPPTIELTTTQDRSKNIRTMLADLQNSVVTGIILVAIIILATLGFRSTAIIGLAIPFSALVGILGLALAGLTVNIVVLFSLILAVGQLVDDAIIVGEFAERRMAEGIPPKEAYALAATRMTGPVIAATATRVAAFSPLLFWPGIVGEFMKYLPITLIATLSASLSFALFFAPALGSLIGRPPREGDAAKPSRAGVYMRTVGLALRHPGKTILLAIALLVLVPVLHGKLGKGVEFFPDVEPDYALVQVRARGNLSLTEKDQLVRLVEARMEDMGELGTIYTRVGEMPRGQNAEVSADTIGIIQFEFTDWRHRRRAQEIMEDLRSKMAEIPGIEIAVTKPKAGPPTGKPVQIELSALDPAKLEPAAAKIAAMLAARKDTKDIDNGLPLPGIDWTLRLDRGEAAKVGAAASTVGTAVQLVTNGVKLTEYRPATTDKSVDVLLRFPKDRRSLDQLDDMLVNTPVGPVPIGSLVKREATRSVGILNRVNANRVIAVSANVAEGVQSAQVQKEVTEALAKMDLGSGVFFRLKGEDEERAKASAFLSKAFGAAMFLIFAIMLAQFNSFRSVGLILSSVILSTIGVFLGLIIMQQPFGVVMTGLGIISLAGVIVNNNIVLIDTYDHLRGKGMAVDEAILRTCAERARPVVMTAFSSAIGVAPIAFGINIDFLDREVTMGAPATQWWIQLSAATLFGLTFATLLTLIVTPAALKFMANITAWRAARRDRKFAAA
ncbi:MAG TPA: efflux RND transporter permease subunit [Rhabdaerophilum sp.]|nr:efflux RND transporter permease subunit [Rhabdaerophilum sp.]